jgi:hypothetical protein
MMWRSHFILVMIVACCSGQSPKQETKPSAASYFPLQVGNRWEYGIGQDRTAREVREVIAEVSDLSGKWYRIVTFFQSDDPFHKPATETLVRLEGSHLVEKDPDNAPDVMVVDFGAQRGRQYRVEHRCAAFATNLSSGAEIQVKYRRNGCADTGVLRATFRANVGLVSFTSDSFGGPIIRRLVAARIAGKDLTF